VARQGLREGGGMEPEAAALRAAPVAGRPNCGRVTGNSTSRGWPPGGRHLRERWAEQAAEAIEAFAACKSGFGTSLNAEKRCTGTAFLGTCLSCSCFNQGVIIRERWGPDQTRILAESVMRTPTHI